MRTNIKKNILSSFGGQLIIIALGIVMPRIIIISYGSDANGLLSTISQIFTYMSLLEAGIGQAAKNALYKPITDNNRADISYVISAARNYFRKITFIYGIGVIILSLIAPYVLKTEISAQTVFFAVLFEGMSGVVTFYFIQTPSTLLTADSHGYVNNNINTVIKVFCYIAKIGLALIGANIVILQLGYFLLSLVKVALYNIYVNKNYKWIDYKKAPKNAKLKDRNAYVINEVAWTMFSSTDIIVLSMCVSTQISSIYAIYNMVFSQLNVLLNAVYNSVSYILGQAYHDNLEKYKDVHDAFTSVFLGIMTLLMTTSYVLVIPFIKLYTQGVLDVNYIYTSLPILFCLIQMLSWSRYVSGNLTGLAGYAQITSRVSLIEAVINFGLSIVLVNWYGIVGVLFATVIALPLKVIWCMYISDKKVMKRTLKKSLSIMLVNFALLAMVAVGNQFIHLNITSYPRFFLYGIVVFSIMGIIVLAANLAVNPRMLQFILHFIKGKRK